jgi:signal transduction histidine kinase
VSPAGLSEAVLANEQVTLTPHLQQQFVLIRSSGLRLLTLVNDILDATALQRGGLRLKLGRVALKPLLDDVIDLTRPLVSGSFRGAGAGRSRYTHWT